MDEEVLKDVAHVLGNFQADIRFTGLSGTSMFERGFDLLGVKN